MTLVTATVEDVHGSPDNSVWIFHSLLREASDGSGIVTPKPVRVTPVAGVLSVNLDPGFSAVAYRGKEYVIEVTDVPADLWDLIAASAAFPPGTPPTLVAAAVMGYLATHPLQAVNISDSSASGRTVLTGTPAAALTAIGATEQSSFASAHNSAVNLLIDGSYERDATWWAGEIGTGKALSTTQAFSGTQSFKITGSRTHRPTVTVAGKTGSDATYGLIKSEGGRVYRLSCRVWRPAANTSSGFIRARLDAAGAGGTDTIAGLGPTYVVNQTDIPTDQWWEYSNTFVVPYSGTNSPYTGICPKISAETVDAADVFYIDNVRFEDMTNAPVELVAPLPTGIRATDTQNVQRLVDLAQTFRGTVVLRAGTYAVDLVTAKVNNQPRIVGQGKQYTKIDGTIKFQGVSSKFSGGYLYGFSFTGVHTGQTALELNGVCDVHWDQVRVEGTYDVGVEFKNELAGDYSELNSGSMDFYLTCATAVKYTVVSGDASFHGSGLTAGSNVQTSGDASVIIIGASARPYNAPMSVHIWTPSATPLIQHNGQATSNFFGNFCIEATGIGGSVVIGAGSSIWHTGTLNTYNTTTTVNRGTWQLVPGGVEIYGASSVKSYVGLTIASSGSRPGIVAAGPPTDIGIALQPKNAGDVVISVGAGQKALLGASGPDSVYDLYLSPKSTGGIRNGSSSATSPGWFTGTGSPEGAQAAPPGSYYTNLSGGAGTTLYVKISGTGNTGWGATLPVTLVASGVNYLQSTDAATGASPLLTAEGTDTDISVGVRPKGAGNFVVSVEAGQVAKINATGPDTNIELRLSGKGSGLVKANGVEVATISGTQVVSGKSVSLATNTLTGTTAQFNTALSDGDFATLDGTETLTSKTLTSPKVGTAILDSNGNTIIGFAPSASAVNYLQFRNKVAGGNPTIEATGSASTIGVQVVPKGTGSFSISVTAGQTPTIQAIGVDTDASLNLVTQAAGVVKANGNPVGVKVAVPATAAATGVPGQWAADASWHYVCIAANTWVRSAAATW